MLEFEKSLPPDVGDGTPVMVLLHGRGSHGGDLQSLADLLPEGVALVTPQAPHPGAPWGYGPGWAWYRFLGEDRLDAVTLGESVDALDGFYASLPTLLGFQPGPISMGGFSQGGTTSLTYALRRPGSLVAAINFSGFLPHDEALGAAEDGWEATPLFWGHGTRDPAIPHSLAVRGRSRLLTAGANLTAKDYPIGHWIAPEEMADLRDWLSGIG